MDPVSPALMLVGMGMQIFGGVSAANTQKQIAQSSSRVAGLEMQADAQRRQQMELDSNRKQMEVFRNNQRARAQALNNATSSGSQFGSGLQGGYGQISGMSGTNLLGIQQNTKIGENLFDINKNISQEKITQANLGGQLATDQMWSNIGAAVGRSAGTVGSLSKGLGGGGGGGSPDGS